MKRLLALLAALTVLLALAGCGASEDTGDSQEDPTQVEETLPEEENTEEEAEEPQEPETEDPAEEETLPENEETPAEDDSEKAPAETGMTLSRTDFTLFKAGSTYKLIASGVEGACTYTSSNPKVATVGTDGTVTAVAPGNATITVTNGSEKRTCVVRCNWTESKPEEKPEEKPAESDSVDLTAFYNDTIANYEFQALQAFTGDILDTYYPGMSDVVHQAVPHHGHHDEHEQRRVLPGGGHQFFGCGCGEEDPAGPCGLYGGDRCLVSRPHGALDQFQPGGVQRKLCDDGSP